MRCSDAGFGSTQPVAEVSHVAVRARYREGLAANGEYGKTLAAHLLLQQRGVQFPIISAPLRCTATVRLTNLQSLSKALPAK